VRIRRLVLSAAAALTLVSAVLIVANRTIVDAPPHREGPHRATPGSPIPAFRIALDPVAAPAPLPLTPPLHEARAVRPGRSDPPSPRLAAQAWPSAAPIAQAPAIAVHAPGRSAPGTAARAAPEAAPRMVPAVLTDPSVAHDTLNDLLAAQTPDETDSSSPSGGVPVPAVLARFTPVRIAQLLGTPVLVRHEGPAEYWQYRTGGCVLGVYFHTLGTVKLVSHVDARGRRDRPGIPGDTTAGDCLAELVAARPRS